MQMVFQDPFRSLDPTMTIKHIIGEALEIHKIARGQELERKVVALLEEVGLGKEHLNRYPHEFSGGQRQRIGIARSLATNPKFIVLDEPTSALDVSVQAQILNLLKDLQTNLGLTYLLISHNLSSVKHLSNRIVIMYLGRLVEIGETEEVFEKPLHPYTQALISSIPALPGYDGIWRRQRILLTGDVPSPINPPAGCRFNPRCRHVRPLCKEKDVELVEVSSSHFVACPRWDDLIVSKD